MLVWFKICNPLYTKNTYIPRVSQCLSPRPNWDPLRPFSRKQMCPPPPRNQRGGTQGEGVGESHFGRLEKRPLSTLCVNSAFPARLRMFLFRIYSVTFAGVSFSYSVPVLDYSKNNAYHATAWTVPAQNVHAFNLAQPFLADHTVYLKLFKKNSRNFWW